MTEARSVLCWLQFVEDGEKMVLFHDDRGYAVKLIGGYEMRYIDVQEAVEELVQELRILEVGEEREDTEHEDGRY